MRKTDFEGVLDLVIIIKAAPEIGRKHGETVCAAGIDSYGRWHRLYPVPFKDLKHNQRFRRWDRVRVRWRHPVDDPRSESKRIDPQSLTILGQVPDRERGDLVERAIATSLEEELAEGRSLALIRPVSPRFTTVRLSNTELQKSQRRRDELHAQSDMFANAEIPKEAPPFSFRYRFHHAGKDREHQCIDWETERTFFKWRDVHGETETIRRMTETWSSFNNLTFAMGTHRVSIWNTWLLSGLIRTQLSEQPQLSL